MKRKTPYIMLFVIIAVTLFIWSNSLATVSQSSAVSGGISEKLLQWLDPEGKFDRDFFEWCLRKLAHFSEFALLGAAYMGLKLSAKKPQLFTLLFCCMATALCDETLQLLSDRSAEVRDVWIDFSGAVFGIVLVAAIFRLVRKLVKNGPKTP